MIYKFSSQRFIEARISQPLSLYRTLMTSSPHHNIPAFHLLDNYLSTQGTSLLTQNY